MTTVTTLQCTCAGTCGGHFRFVGGGGVGEATDKVPFNAGESAIQARDVSRDRHVIILLSLLALYMGNG